jgi:hypothetical protein
LGSCKTDKPVPQDDPFELCDINMGGIQERCHAIQAGFSIVGYGQAE